MTDERRKQIADEIDKILSKVSDDKKENNPAAALMIMINFTLGAVWADRTMIEKACKWLEKNVCTAYNFNGDEITSTIIDDFRKAMEGGEE